MTVGFSIIFILIGHVVADFYAQTNRIAQGKTESMRLLAIHGALYALCLAPFSLLAFSVETVFPAWLVLSVSHSLVDGVKVASERHRWGNPLILFCVDQATHAAICILVALVAFGGVPLVNLASPVVAVMGFDSTKAMIVALLSLLIAWRPASIFVQLLLRSIRVDNEPPMHEGNEKGEQAENSEDQELQAGRWIGMLERTIIAVLSLCNQFSAIAFVLTAKSIARFKMLDDRVFAECYLLGTLASTSIAIVATLAIQGIASWS